MLEVLVVTVDVGGKRKGYGSGYRENKAVIVGAVQRGGEIRLKVLPNVRRGHIHGFIKQHVSGEAEAIFTDELASYRGIGDDDTRHETVEHSADEWVRGDVHTNTVESVWSLFKRSVVGSYHQLSLKHLPAYLDEIEFRFNNRDNPFLFRDTLLVLLSGDPLPYRKLVDQPGPLRPGRPPIKPLDPEGHAE